MADNTEITSKKYGIKKMSTYNFANFANAAEQGNYSQAKIRVLENKNLYHTSLCEGADYSFDELKTKVFLKEAQLTKIRNFSGALIMVSANWFNTHNADEFRKEIKPYQFILNGKPVKSKTEKRFFFGTTEVVYVYAIENVDESFLQDLADRFDFTYETKGLF